MNFLSRHILDTDFCKHLDLSSNLPAPHIESQLWLYIYLSPELSGAQAGGSDYRPSFNFVKYLVSREDRAGYPMFSFDLSTQDHMHSTHVHIHHKEQTQNKTKVFFFSQVGIGQLYVVGSTRLYSRIHVRNHIWEHEHL